MGPQLMPKSASVERSSSFKSSMTSLTGKADNNIYVKQSLMSDLLLYFSVMLPFQRILNHFYVIQMLCKLREWALLLYQNTYILGSSQIELIPVSQIVPIPTFPSGSTCSSHLHRDIRKAIVCSWGITGVLGEGTTAQLAGIPIQGWALTARWEPQLQSQSRGGWSHLRHKASKTSR